MARWTGNMGGQAFGDRALHDGARGRVLCRASVRGVTRILERVSREHRVLVFPGGQSLSAAKLEPPR
jgi:hypothetical protein